MTSFALVYTFVEEFRLGSSTAFRRKFEKKKGSFILGTESSLKS